MSLHSIFFTELSLNEDVHMQALGFTKWVPKYAYATSPEEACAVAKKWGTAVGCDVQKVTAKIAALQDITTYTFPHQVINLPKEILDAEYDRRRYPPEYRDPGQYVTLP